MTQPKNVFEKALRNLEIGGIFPRGWKLHRPLSWSDRHGSRVPDGFDRRTMAGNFAIDPSGQARRPASVGEYAAGAGRVVLPGANGVRLADAAQGLSAQGHRVVLLQEVSRGRHVGANS
jgi:hypothetical protein